MGNQVRGLSAPLALSALLLAACGTASKTAMRNQEESQFQTALQAQAWQAVRAASDSVRYRSRNQQQEMTEMRETFAERIPIAQASVTIPKQSLLDLPEGATYVTTSGRASVEALGQGDSIVLTGRCDSVARQCTLYERKTFSQKNSIDSLNAVIDNLHSKISRMSFEAHSDEGHSAIETQSKAHPHNNLRWLIAGIAIGVAGGMAAQWAWRRFGIGTIMKGLFLKILKY